MPINIDKNRFNALSKLELVAKQVVHGFITGLHKSPLHGFSVEFAEHRIYNQGESTKNIDWKLYARTDKLFVKRYEEETNLRCRILLDISPSMFYPNVDKVDIDNLNKIHFSIYAAAAIIEILRKQRDAYGLAHLSDNIEFISQIKAGEVHARNLYLEMEKILTQTKAKKQSTTVLADSLHQVAEMTHKRSLIIIFSDMFETNADNEKLFSALRHLKHNKHEVLLFHVVDKETEIDFEFSNHPYKFVDLESNEEIKLKPSDFQELYNTKLNVFYKNLKDKAQQYQIDFIEADIKKGFVPILQDYLLKRQKML
jgi:uncharacterized protein (DUF58 family)